MRTISAYITHEEAASSYSGRWFQAQEKIIGYQDIYTQAFQFQLNLYAIDVLFIKAF